MRRVTIAELRELPDPSGAYAKTIQRLGHAPEHVVIIEDPPSVQTADDIGGGTTRVKEVGEEEGKAQEAP